MRVSRPVSAVSSALTLLLSCSAFAQAQGPVSPQSPPVAPVRPVVDNYHGINVADPYRYMENLQDPEVQSWLKGQNDYTRAVLASLPGRGRLLPRIEEISQSKPRVFPWPLPGGAYLVEKILPGENVSKLYRREGLNGEDVLLVNPEKVKLAASSQSKGSNTIWGLATSGDLKYLAVCIVPGGSELDGELHVFEVATGRETGDVITHVGAEAFDPYWLPDSHSFVYGHMQKLSPGAPESEMRQKFRAYLHMLGTNPEKDPPVFGYGIVPSIQVDPSLIASVQTQSDSSYALGILNGSVTRNSAYYISPVNAIGKSNPSWRKLADFADGVTAIAMHGDDLYALTYKNTPRYKVLRTNARQPDLVAAEVVVPAGEAVIQGIAPAQDALYVQLLDGGIGRLLRVPYGHHPKAERVDLPFDGSVLVRSDPRVPGALLLVTSWTKAFKIYRYDPSTGEVTDTRIQPAGRYDDPEDIHSVEVKAKSYDGTLVPLSIIYPKRIRLDGSNPTLLTGYGSYGDAYTPTFAPRLLAWYERDGIYAVCHVRGGGEYGEEWHLSGKDFNKPNTWKDFIACAQYLINNKYTSPAHLAGMGTSAGGVLIGRAITERPDLFGAAIDNVGLSDTLRSETTQNGETNIPEFGSTRTEAGFKALYAMSAYDHVEDKTRYPAVLLKTGMNDPRVAPWEMAKMAARLQASTSSGKPVLLRIEYAGGHGGMGADRKQQLESFADDLSFLFWQLGVPEFQPKSDAHAGPGRMH